MQAVYYRALDRSQPVNDFINTLDDRAAAKIDWFVDEHLNGNSVEAPPPEHPVSSQIEGPLRELRVRFGRTHYRILVQRSENLFVQLHAFEKNTGKVLDADKALAKKRIDDFHVRMNADPRERPRAVGQDAPPASR